MVEYQHGVGWAHMFPRRLESPGTEYSVVVVARGLPGKSLSTWSDGSERRNLDIESFGRVDELPRTDLRAETVLLHDEDSLLGKWELFLDLPAANYRVFSDRNLLIYSNARREDPMRLDDTVILAPRGEIVSKGTFGRDVLDVQITAGGDMWVAFGEPEVGDDRIFNGIAKFSPTFEVLWAPENELIETYDVAVLGESALIWGRTSGEARVLPEGGSVRPGLLSPFGVMHRSESRQWGFLELGFYGDLFVTLGWTGYDGEWKPHARSIVECPPTSRFEAPVIECDADRMYYWVGNRWSTVTLDNLFDNTSRQVAARLPAVDG